MTSVAAITHNDKDGTSTETFTYDTNDDVTSDVVARGGDIAKSTSYEYDALGRPTAVTAGGATRTYTWDSCTHGIGRLCTASTTGSSVAYSYSPEGWITGRAFNVGGVIYALGYAYDGMGQLATVDYPDGNAALYDYVDGAVADVRLNVGGSTVNAATGITYRPGDLAMTGWTSSNGLANTIQYDADLRPTSSSVPNVESLAFGYDADDQISTITNGMNAAQSETLGYDADGRLTAESSTSDHESYGYDADGNRTTQTINGTATNFSYASASNELVATSGGAGLANIYGYDANGNTVSLNGTTAYTYGPFNRLINAPGASFTIGAEGQRLAKIGGGDTTYFAADAGGSLLAENDSGTWHDNVWLNGRLIGVIANGNIYAAHTDQTGRPIALTNASDTIVWQANGLPFDRQVTANTYGDFNLGFPGQYHDSEDGLYQNGNRDYDPATGRYIESDPIGLGGGINTYTYTASRPIRNIDPLGLWSFTFEDYIGFGGAITFGYDKSSGGLFYGGRLGVGFSIGGSVDPNGKRPGAGKDGDCDGPGTTLGKL